MAAGLGFKTFTTGEVLTAADTNGYLMQGILVFASAAARDAAITSPQEGQFAYLKDTNVTTYYTGSAWANVDTTGMTNPMTTTGDTIYSSSGSTPARLGIGSTGQVLTVAAGLPSWATPSAGGMTLISTTSLTGTTVSLSSIPQTYKNLQLVIRNYNCNTNSSMNMRINGADSSTNYKSVLIRTSSTTSINREENRFIFMDGTTDQKSGSNNSAATINFFDYTQATNINFTASYTYMNTSSVTNAVFANAVFKPDSVAAITTITLFFQSADFAGGTALLYGVS